MITLDDISENSRDIAMLVGIDVYLMLVDNFGGSRLYIPTRASVDRCVRNRNIKKEYRGDVREMVRKYKISETHVRNIIK